MKINSYGQTSLTEKEIFDALYTKTIDTLLYVSVDDKNVSEKFNLSNKENFEDFHNLNFFTDLNISKEEFDKINQSEWFYLKSYKDFDITNYLYNICPDYNKNRLKQELILYEKNNLLEYYIQYEYPI